MCGIDGTIDRGSAESVEQEAPAAGTEFRRLVEPELQLDVHETGSVLSALEIATHPVKAVGDTRKHAGFALERLYVVIAWRAHIRQCAPTG